MSVLQVAQEHYGNLRPPDIAYTKKQHELIASLPRPMTVQTNKKDIHLAYPLNPRTLTH